MLIDTHAHLMFDQFKGEVPEVLQSASAAGVTKIINVGCSVEASKEAFKQVEKFNHRYEIELFAALGLHPYDASDLSDNLLDEWARMIEVAGGSEGGRIVAIGEIGLDYFKAPVPHDIQKDAFRGQLQFASQMKLPVIVHNREADEDCLEILSEFPDLKVVFHCYASSLEFAKRLWEKGYYTSFTGIITYPKSDELRQVVSACPEGQFMIETDCPYLAPQQVRGERNEPAHVSYVAKMVAKLKGLTFEDAGKISSENANMFFGL